MGYLVLKLSSWRMMTSMPIRNGYCLFTASYHWYLIVPTHGGMARRSWLTQGIYAPTLTQAIKFCSTNWVDCRATLLIVTKCITIKPNHTSLDCHVPSCLFLWNVTSQCILYRFPGELGFCRISSSVRNFGTGKFATIGSSYRWKTGLACWQFVLFCWSFVLLLK